jgi:hypothetical protein
MAENLQNQKEAQPKKVPPGTRDGLPNRTDKGLEWCRGRKDDHSSPNVKLSREMEKPVPASQGRHRPKGLP